MDCVNRRAKADEYFIGRSFCPSLRIVCRTSHSLEILMSFSLVIALLV